MLGHDFNSWGVETRRGSIPPLRRMHVSGKPQEWILRPGATAPGYVIDLGWLIIACPGHSPRAQVSAYNLIHGLRLVGKSRKAEHCNTNAYYVDFLRSVLRHQCLRPAGAENACTPTPLSSHNFSSGGRHHRKTPRRGESGWWSDMTSTHGAWRHAGIRFLLSGGLSTARALLQHTGRGALELHTLCPAVCQLPRRP